MELIYLFIYEFRKIKQQSFNFAADLEFNLTVVPDTVPNYKLQISQRGDFLELFDNKVLNVSCLIGKNGSGKSSLLNCLKLMCGNLHRLTSPLIFCVRDVAQNTIHTCYFSDGELSEMDGLKLEIVSSSQVRKAYKLTKNPYRINRFAFDKDYIKGLPFNFEDIACCFFSNAFDGQFEVIYEGINNLSSNQRVEDFLKNYIQEELWKDKNEQQDKNVKIFPSHIAEYHDQQTKTYLDFLAYAKTHSKHPLVDLPETLTVVFDFKDFIYLINQRGSRIKYPKQDLEKIQQKALAIIQQTTSYVASMHHLIILCTFYYALRWNKLEKDMRTDIYQILKRIASDDTDLFEELRFVLNRLPYRDYDQRKENLIKRVLSVGFRQDLEKLTYKHRDYNRGLANFEFEITPELWPVISTIHNLTALDNTFFLNYGWGGQLSTGQEAFIAHFARLFEIKGKVGDKPIWLLIDEGDLHFHPEMQKQYFNNLLNLVQLIFPQNKVQYFLCTHSPFIVSDLPKQNLIFMKSKNGQCVVDHENMQRDTFGANIHELFKDALFLSGSLMGDFAKAKIDGVIRWCLSQEGWHPSEADHMRLLVGHIGEPILRTKLSEMIAQKTGDNAELAKLREQERYIQNRIREITDNNDQN